MTRSGSFLMWPSLRVRLLIAVLALFAAPELARAAECSPAPGDYTFEMVLEEVTRSYDVHVPPNCDSESEIPFVFNFHGLGSNKTEQTQVSGLIAKADEQGFIAVHPQGHLNSWNSGWCCSFSSHQLDDVAFARAIVDALDVGLPIDRSRVYTTGLSNGGAMSHWLACNAADMIAAAVPVSYHLSTIDACAPSQPVAVLQIHGTNDEVVPYLGLLSWPTAPESIERWAGLNGCNEVTTRTVDLPSAYCDEHQDCSEGATSALCTLIDAPHVPYAAATEAGVPIADIAWEFFENKTLVPEPASVVLQLAGLASLVSLANRRRRIGPAASIIR